MIAFFIALVFFALRNSLKAQQNRVWVGLSKETAHQLGTPISSLVAWIEFLKLKDIDPALLSEIDKDVHRLEMIARRFSKIGSATDLRQADLREVVRRSLGYMEKRISDKVRIDLDFPEHGVTVTVSEPLFDWVIENLLKNAVDAMGGEGTVLFHISERRGKVLLDISDTGKGVPKSQFKPFLSRIHHQGAWLGTWPVACEADCGGIPQRKDFCEGIGAWERNHVQDGAEMIIYLLFFEEKQHLTHFATEQDVAEELFELLLEARELYLQDVILNGKRYDRYVDDFINSHRYINCNSAICRNCHEMNIHIVKGLLNECAHLIQPLFEASDFSFEKCMELQRKYDRSEPLPPYSWHGARGLLCMASATSWVPLSQEIRIPGHTSM